MGWSIIRILAGTLGLVGLFWLGPVALIIGGGFCFITDILAILSGGLKPSQLIWYAIGTFFLSAIMSFWIALLAVASGLAIIFDVLGLILQRRLLGSPLKSTEEGTTKILPIKSRDTAQINEDVHPDD